MSAGATAQTDPGGFGPLQVQRLAELTSQLADAAGLPTLVARLAQGLSPIVDFDQLALAMRGGDGRTWALVRPRLAQGGEPSWLELSDPDSPLEEAMRDDRPLRTDRPGTHLLPPGLEASSPIVDLSLFPSSISVPIRGPDGPLGALGAFCARAGAYGPSDLHLLQVVALMVEATARKLVLLDELARAERELHRMERLRGDLLQLILADLHGPLTTLSGGLDRLGTTILPPGATEARNAVVELQRDAAALEEMLANVADAGRLEEGQVGLRRESVALGPFFQERVKAKAVLAKGQDVAVVARVEPDAARANVDAQLLGRALDALLESALAHAPRRGQVALVGKLVNRTLTIAIGDTGPEIPAEQRDRMFTKYGALVGEGELSRPNRALGLYFAKLVAELHGGRIVVEDPPAGVGALVRVTLPA